MARVTERGGVDCKGSDGRRDASRGETLAQREAGELRMIAETELAHDPSPVRFDRRPSNRERARDLGTRPALADQLEHLELPAGETVERIGPARGLKQDLRDIRADR